MVSLLVICLKIVWDVIIFILYVWFVVFVGFRGDRISELGLLYWVDWIDEEEGFLFFRVVMDVLLGR